MIDIPKHMKWFLEISKEEHLIEITEKIEKHFDIMLTGHTFEPLNLKQNSIPLKSNGKVLLLNVDGNWYGSSEWEHENENEDIYFVQDGEEYYIMKNRIKAAYLITEK